MIVKNKIEHNYQSGFDVSKI